MKIFGLLCLFGVMGFNCAFGKPGHYYPRAYMIGSSYYANPRFVRQGPGYDYIPPGQMTAMVLGDTVATNTFSGPGWNPPSPPAVLTVPNTEVGQIEDDQVSEQVTDKQQPLLISIPESDSINETEPQEPVELEPEQPNKNLGGELDNLFPLEEVTTEAVVPTIKSVPVNPSKAPSAGRKGKTGKAKRPATTVAPPPAEEDEEDDDAGLPASWPFGGSGRAGIPNYNAFFPIFIGGSSPSGRSRTRSTDEGGYPGSATAIANSFSTGKGGVATSHATSFGDPYAAAMLRNAGLFNFRTKSTKKQVILNDD